MKNLRTQASSAKTMRTRIDYQLKQKSRTRWKEGARQNHRSKAFTIAEKTINALQARNRLTPLINQLKISRITSRRDHFN